MRNFWLIVLGTCFGAVGAWIVMSDDPEPIAGLDDNRATSTTRSISSPVGRSRGSESRSDDSLDTTARLIALESIEILADVSPLEAFNEALTLDAFGLRVNSLVRVGRAWARNAPEEALAQATELPERLRLLFESAVAEEWAFVDPSGFLAFAEVAASIDQLVDGLHVLLASEPQRVWEIVARRSRLDKPAIEELYLSVIREMTHRDPNGTVARLQPLATGLQRDPILTSIAEAYTALDPDAALAWVMSLEPSSHDAVSTVIRFIASGDMIRAYDLVRQDGGSALSVDSVRWLLAESAVESEQDPATIASKLVQRVEPEYTDQLLSAILNFWVRKAPDDAMAWLSANQASVTADTITTMVSNIATNDVQLAASLSDRVPAELRFEWLDGVAFRYGQFDAEGGLDWVSRYRSRTDYDELLTRLLAGVTVSDPQFVANYIETSNRPISNDLIENTAAWLVSEDPHSAIQWAERLGDPEQSVLAQEGVVSGWVQTDAVATQQWVLDQPRSESRDRILDRLMNATGFFPYDLDYKALADAYTSRAAAEATMAQYIENAVGFPVSSPYRDAAIAQAEQMFNLLTDSILRRQAQESFFTAR